jgi:cytochrome c oxidase subunit 1
VKRVERLTLAHLWVAFAALAVACFFGVWQMWARSPLPAPFVTPDHYFLSVTAHGVASAAILGGRASVLYTFIRL